jgi:hypothetical protein
MGCGNSKLQVATDEQGVSSMQNEVPPLKTSRLRHTEDQVPVGAADCEAVCEAACEADAGSTGSGPGARHDDKDRLDLHTGIVTKISHPPLSNVVSHDARSIGGAYDVAGIAQCHSPPSTTACTSSQVLGSLRDDHPDAFVSKDDTDDAYEKPVSKITHGTGFVCNDDDWNLMSSILEEYGNGDLE